MCDKRERTPINSNALCMTHMKLRQIGIETQNYSMETPPTLGKKDLTGSENCHFS